MQGVQLGVEVEILSAGVHCRPDQSLQKRREQVEYCGMETKQENNEQSLESGAQ